MTLVQASSLSYRTVVMDNLLAWPSLHALVSPCSSWPHDATRVSASNPAGPLLQSHSVALYASSSQHTPHIPYPQTTSILAPTFKEATLLNFQASFAFAHPLTFWQTPALLPRPDAVISCEAFCSPGPPPTLVSAVCSMMMLTAPGGAYFSAAVFRSQ